MPGLNRRTFLQRSATGTLGLGIARNINSSIPDFRYSLPKIKEYRKLGRTGELVSDIGSGVPYSESVLKAVIEAGVNFIETSETYENGRNEVLIGNAIRNYEREKLFIVTKINLSTGLTTSTDEIIRRAEASLKRINSPYVDLYMMHQAQSIVKVADKHFHKACDTLQKAGKIRHRGLSCHGTFWWQEQGGTLEDLLMAAIRDGRYDVLFFPYNFLDPDMGDRIIKLCKSNNIGTMVMKSNPISIFEGYENIIRRGEKLRFLEQKDYNTKKLQMEKAKDFFRKYSLVSSEDLKRGAYRFILSNKDVSTICCRFRNFSDIEMYVSLSGTTLDGPTAELLSDFRESLGFLNCRMGCNLCEKKCPVRMPINTILRFYYYSQALKENAAASEFYRLLEGPKADICRNCDGLCEKSCPHGVAVRELLTDAHHVLT